MKRYALCVLVVLFGLACEEPHGAPAGPMVGGRGVFSPRGHCEHWISQDAGPPPAEAPTANTLTGWFGWPDAQCTATYAVADHGDVTFTLERPTGETAREGMGVETLTARGLGSQCHWEWLYTLSKTGQEPLHEYGLRVRLCSVALITPYAANFSQVRIPLAQFKVGRGRTGWEALVLDGSVPVLEDAPTGCPANAPEATLEDFRWQLAADFMVDQELLLRLPESTRLQVRLELLTHR